jgi:O-antigen/teichoic acid export membrane protein
MPVLREFGRGSAWSLLVIGMGLGLTFAAQVILARWLSTEDYGTYRYVVNIGTIAMLFAAMGVPQILVRGIAGASARTNSAAEIFGYVEASRYVYAGCVAIVLALGAAALAVLHGRVSEKIFGGLCLLLLLVPFDLLAGRPATILRGLKRVAAALMCDNIVIPLGLIVFASAFWLAGAEGVMPAIATEILAAATSLIFGTLVLRKWLKTRVPAETPLRTRLRSIVKDSVWLALASPLSQLSRYLDVLILGIFAPMSEVALYAVASRVAALASFGLRASAPVTGPLIAERFAHGDMPGVEKVAFLAAAMSTIYAVGFLTILLLAGHLILGLFGAEYPGALPLLLIMTAGYVVNATVGGVAQLLVMTRHQKAYVMRVVAAVCVNAILNLILIPPYGAFGAAYATLAAQLVMAAINAITAGHLLKVNSSVFNWRLLSEIKWTKAGIRALLKTVFARKAPRSPAPHGGTPAVAEEL